MSSAFFAQAGTSASRIQLSFQDTSFSFAGMSVSFRFRTVRKAPFMDLACQWALNPLENTASCLPKSVTRPGNLAHSAPPADLGGGEEFREKGHVHSHVWGIWASSSHGFQLPQETWGQMQQNTGFSNYVCFHVGRRVGVRIPYPPRQYFSLDSWPTKNCGLHTVVTFCSLYREDYSRIEPPAS